MQFLRCEDVSADDSVPLSSPLSLWEFSSRLPPWLFPSWVHIIWIFSSGLGAQVLFYASVWFLSSQFLFSLLGYTNPGLRKKDLSGPFLASRSTSSISWDSLKPRGQTNGLLVDSRKSIEGFLAVFHKFRIRNGCLLRFDRRLAVREWLRHCSHFPSEGPAPGSVDVRYNNESPRRLIVMVSVQCPDWRLSPTIIPISSHACKAARSGLSSSSSTCLKSVGSVGKDLVYHACGHELKSRLKWKFSNFQHYLWLLLSDYGGMDMGFGVHYNQEVRFSSAVKCKKRPQVLTSLLNQRRNYYYYIE